MFKFSMEAGPPMSYELVVQRNEGHIFSYHGSKRPTFFLEPTPKKFAIANMEILAPKLVGDQSEIVV